MHGIDVERIAAGGRRSGDGPGGLGLQSDELVDRHGRQPARPEGLPDAARRRPPARRSRRRVPPRRRRPGTTRTRDHEPPRRARARRPRRARRVPAGRRRRHGGVRRLRARVGVGGPPGRGDGGRRARPADRGDRRRRDRRAVRAHRRAARAAARPGRPRRRARVGPRRSLPACGAGVGGEVGCAALRHPPRDRDHHHSLRAARRRQPGSAVAGADPATRQRDRPASGDARRQRTDPRPARRVARMGRRQLATASCSRGSTSAIRSVRRSPGWSSATVESSRSACSCAGCSGGAGPRCTRCGPWTRRRTPTTRDTACSRR